MSYQFTPDGVLRTCPKCDGTEQVDVLVKRGSLGETIEDDVYKTVPCDCDEGWVAMTLPELAKKCQRQDKFLREHTRTFHDGGHGRWVRPDEVELELNGHNEAK